MKFKAKVDRWVHVTLSLIFGLLILMLVMRVLDDGIIDGLILISIAAPMLYIIPILVSTYYLLDDNKLVIKTGLFPSRKIPYGSIRNARPYRSWWVSSITVPVMSVDMIEIAYIKTSGSTYNYIYVAPRHRHEFLRELQARFDKEGETVEV